MGPTPSSCQTFPIKNMLIPNIYLPQLLVVRFLSLKKIDENLILETQELANHTKNGKTSMLADATPWAHFQKLDVEKYNFFSYLGLGTLSSFGLVLF